MVLFTTKHMVKVKLSCMDFVKPKFAVGKARHEANGDCAGDFNLQLIDGKLNNKQLIVFKLSPSLFQCNILYLV